MRRCLLQSLPVFRPGAPLCIVPSLPVRLGTVSPHCGTDVFVLDVDKFTVRAMQKLERTRAQALRRRLLASRLIITGLLLCSFLMMAGLHIQKHPSFAGAL